MRNVFAKTSNVTKFVSSMGRLMNAGDKIPRMGLVYGHYGTGRTETATWYLGQHPEVAFIRTLTIMNTTWLLRTILSELGVVPEARKEKCWDQLTDVLLETPRLLMFDEVDLLAKDPDIINTLRSIHDVTGTRIVFLGEEYADKKLRRFGNLFDRFSEIVRFEDLSEEDLATIIGAVCEVEWSADAIKYAYDSGVRRFRPLIILMYKAEGIARANSLKRIDAEHLKGVRK